ncbi:MAG TPA: leucyl aminopeptidase [Myxococcales bacterium]|nr:leucyl aminopeptidase [Myxococcales bacterium]
MNFSFVAASATQKSDADLLILPLFENDLAPRAAPPALKEADAALGGHLLDAAQQEGFSGKVEQSLVFHTHDKIGAARVALLGLGQRARFTPEVMRLAAGRAARTAQRLKARTAVLVLGELRDLEQCIKAVVEGFVLGAYRFDRYRSRKEDGAGGEGLRSVALGLPGGAERKPAHDEMVELGKRVAEATNWARDLVNEPAGVMTPSRLAREARKLAKGSGLRVKVSGPAEIKKLRLGMFMGVTQGSAEPAQLVRVSWVPKSPKDARKPPVALVGKAITFDSGGLSLKPAEGMVDMKTDMAGSAAVLGAMRVIGYLKPPFPVHALLGACENMPSGTAYRPGDVLVSRLGKTVEITNTDAEGRLVLGDMLTLANELKPVAIVDLATLTGACMIALGHYVAGAFGDDDQLMYSVLEAARAAGEEVWRMPIHDLQKDALKSEVADMKNAGERWGGAINAAVFLREFVGETPWVHLDIAGPSNSPKERGYLIKGATGVGVRTLVELIRRRAAEA